MKFIKWKIYKAPNFYSRFLLFSLLVCSVILTSSCDSKVTTTNKSGICVGEPGTGVAGDCSGDLKNAVSPSAEPIKYSVICFAQEYSDKCGDQYYKIEEGTTVEVFLEKTGGGISENLGYRSTFKALGKQENITKNESDALVNSGSKAYKIAPLHVKFFDTSIGDFIDISGLKKPRKVNGEYNFTGKIIFSTGDSFELVKIDLEYYDNDPNRKRANWLADYQDNPEYRNGDWICEYKYCKTNKLVSYKSTSKVAEASPSSSESISTHPSAAEFIQSYYQLLNERNYTDSWDKLSTSFQQKSQDYKQWWGKVKNIRVSKVENISQDENRATVEAQISYELKDGRVKQDDNKRIYLVWNKTKNEWKIDR
jgi:hypothetical protein